MGIIINGQNDTIGPVDNSMSLLGTVSIGGTMTIEDFTNIDSVGLGTFRNGLQVTGGNVGINEASPDSKFHVNSGAETVPARFESTGSQSRIGFKASGTPTSYHVACGAEANDFIVYTNNTEKLRIESGGFVGLGTNNPYHELHIQGSGDTRALITSGGTGDAVMMFENASGNTWGHGIDLTNNNYVVAYNSTSDPSLTSDNKLIVKTDGDVYIGNSAHANDAGRNTSYRTLTLADTTNGAQLQLRGQSPILYMDATGTPGNAEMYYDTNNLRILSGEPGVGGSTERLRFDGNGKIGIGDFSSTTISHMLHLKSTGDATILIQADTDNNGENDNPRILLAQDGGTHGMLEIGLIGDANSPLNNTLANGCYIQANNHVDQPLFLGHMGENVMTIRDGKVGITTHDPQSELHLYSNAPVISATATNTSSGLRLNVLGQSSASSQLFRVQDNNSTRFTITQDGFMGVANSGSRAPAAPLDVYRETNLTGTTGYVFGTFTHHVGSSGDIGRQRSYLDFVFTDANPNFTPQVRIGAQVGWSKGSDQGQPSEGNGSFVVYTGKGTLGVTDGSGTLTERFRVDEDGVVTMSGQVAFEAIRTTDISGGSNGVNLQNKYVTYESENYDIGGNMNLSTGLFTAPVDGIYLFSFGMAIGGGDGGDDSIGVNFRIANNATYYNFTNSNVSDFRINPRSITRTGHEHTYTFTKQVRMAEGATCGFYITDWNYANTVLEYAEFCGCKVA